MFLVLAFFVSRAQNIDIKTVLAQWKELVTAALRKCCAADEGEGRGQKCGHWVQMRREQQTLKFYMHAHRSSTNCSRP